MNRLKSLVPAGNGGAPSIRPRVILWIAAILIYACVNTLLSPAATLLTAESAGRQFDNRDGSAFTALAGISVFTHLGLPLLVLLALLGALWSGVLQRCFVAWVLLGLLAAPHPAAAYYDKSDFTEAYTILPNESGFWIPDIGANKDSQAQFESEAYLNANRVALKRFIVPHAKLQATGSFFDFYVPSRPADHRRSHAVQSRMGGRR